MSKENRKNTTGGGICIFTKDQLKIKLRSDLVKSVNKNSNGNFESLLFK